MDEQTDFAPESQQSANVPRPWIGVHLGVANALHQEYGKNYGPEILKVVRYSPAARAGLAVKDILLGINGTPLGTPEEFLTCLRSYSVGATIKISLRRGSFELSVDVVIGSDGSIA